jgi:hypothetical protein
MGPIFERIVSQQAIVVHSTGAEKITSTRRLLRLAAQMPGYKLSDLDVSQVVSVCQTLFSQNNVKEAVNLLDAADGMIDDSVEPIYRLVFTYFRMQGCSSLTRIADAQSAAQTLLEMTDDVDGEGNPEFESFIQVITETARSILQQEQTQKSDLVRKVGRNQKVVIRRQNSNEEITAKFKLVEREIRSGVAELVRVLPK